MERSNSVFDDIPLLEPKELHGKMLLMVVVENEEGTLLGGKDVESDKIYIIRYIPKRRVLLDENTISSS